LQVHFNSEQFWKTGAYKLEGRLEFFESVMIAKESLRNWIEDD